LQGAKSILEKGQKEPKGQTKILGTASVIWNQIYKIWPQKGQPGNPGLGLRLRFGVYGFTLPDKDHLLIQIHRSCHVTNSDGKLNLGKSQTCSWHCFLQVYLLQLDIT